MTLRKRLRKTFLFKGQEKEAPDIVKGVSRIISFFDEYQFTEFRMLDKKGEPLGFWKHINHLEMGTNKKMNTSIKEFNLAINYQSLQIKFSTPVTIEKWDMKPNYARIIEQ